MSLRAQREALMRRTTLTALLVGLLACAATAQDKDKDDKGEGAAVGKNVPGTFNPFNVTARIVPMAEPDEKGKGEKTPRPDTKGKFHCLVTEYDMDPVVLLVLRDADEAAGVKSLLKKLDAAIGRNSGARLRAFVVCHFDGLVNVVTQDERRAELAEKLTKLAEDLKLKGVVLTLAAPADLAKWKLDTKAAANVILYRRLKVEAVHDLSRDKLEKEEDAALDAVLADVKDKLKAAR